MTDEKNATAYSSRDLAYLGDSVLEVLVRERIVTEGGAARPSEAALRYVTASSQSDAAERIIPHLTETEADVFRRGRNNVHSGNIPKSATVNQYRRATAFECLFGYLYLSGENVRIRELFDIAYGETRSTAVRG